MAKTEQPKRRLVFIVNYLFLIVSGIVTFVVSVDYSDRRLKKHALQSIGLGIIAAILGLVPFIGGLLGFLIWLYGMYVGYGAYRGRDVRIPLVTDLVADLMKD